MTYEKELQQLQRTLINEYILYRQGYMSEKEYLIRTKPIDKAIGELEMSTLQDTLAYKATFSQHSPKLEH